MEQWLYNLMVSIRAPNRKIEGALISNLTKYLSEIYKYQTIKVGATMLFQPIHLGLERVRLGIKIGCNSVEATFEALL